MPLNQEAQVIQNTEGRAKVTQINKKCTKILKLFDLNLEVIEWLSELDNYQPL